MFDDVKLSYPLPNYQEWKSKNRGKIKRPYWNIFEDEGDVKTEEDDGSIDLFSDNELKWREDRNQKYKYSTILHHTGFQTYDVKVKETLRECLVTGNRSTSFNLTIDGSLRANHFGGPNWGRFCFEDLQNQINLLESLGLDVCKVKIDNLAPSICPEMPFPVKEFLDECLISYRGEPFKAYDPDKKGKTIGYYCPQRQVEIKIYDKSLQFNLPNYQMQFEDSFSKMQRLKKHHGIEFLSDLKDYDKVYSLLNVLLQTWDDILLFDPEIDPNDERLNERERDMVLHGYSSKYWDRKKKELGKSTYFSRVNDFRRISEECGSKTHSMIRKLIEDEWNELFKNWTSLPSVKYASAEKQLDKITGTVGGKVVQLYKKNKKQIAKENRIIREKQFQSFIKALSKTLNEMERKSA